MLDERILELINKEIDGVILSAERAILDEYRAKSPEVAEMERDLHAVASALGTVQVVDVPATLKSRVMRSILPRPHREPAARRIIAPILEYFRGTSGVRVAYAFSFGIVAGIALFALYASMSNAGSFDQKDLTGTMIIGASSGRMETGPVVSIATDRVSGAIATQFTHNLAILNVKVASAENVRAEFTYEPSLLAVRAVQRSSDGRSDLAVSGNTVEVRSAGTDGYTIYFDRKSQAASPVRVALYSAGDLVFSREIDTAPQAR